MKKVLAITVPLILLGIIVIIALCIYANNKYNNPTNIPSTNDNTNNNQSENPAGTVENYCSRLNCTSGYAKYVGSINSDKYYTCDCRYAKSINPENIVCFDSDEDALAKNYTKVEC